MAQLTPRIRGAQSQPAQQGHVYVVARLRERERAELRFRKLLAPAEPCCPGAQLGGDGRGPRNGHAEVVEAVAEQRDQPGVTPDLTDHRTDARTAVLGHRTSGERVAGLLQQGGEACVAG